MRYPNCEKAKAFNLFDQGKRPAEIFKLVKVKEHTVFNYHQDWKRERKEETERKRQAEELQRRQKEKERKQEEELSRANMFHALQSQQRIQLGGKCEKQREIVRDLEVKMAREADKQNNPEVQSIGKLYSQAYKEFVRLMEKLYPGHIDEKYIETVLRSDEKINCFDLTRMSEVVLRKISG